MKPKERRDRLFKVSRPNIREMSLIDQQGYTKDMRVLWGSYSRKSDGDKISQEDFAEQVISEYERYDRKWIIEDSNSFCGGYGPIGLVFANHDGWELEPQFMPFEWATDRNILRAAVSFLQMMRYDKDVGIVSVNALSESKQFFNHISKYGVLKYAAKIPAGDILGDKYMYYIRGRKDGDHKH